MCGIIGYFGTQDPKGVLLDGLKRLEYRGYDSAGIAILEQGKVEIFRAEGRLSNLESKVSAKKFTGKQGIGHTRWATHGVPNETNAHPHRAGAITLVHNGIIENYLQHKEELLKAGHTIASETDSEIVAHLFDREIQSGKTLEQSIQAVLPRLRGAYAFVVMSDKEPGVIAGIRNGAPLLVGLGKDEVFFASDVQAILHRTNRIIYLDERQYAISSNGSVTIKDASGKQVEMAIKTIDWTPDQLEMQGYRHYMLKEIYEQPRAVTNTIEGNIDPNEGAISIPELRPLADYLKSIEHISLVACGTARHAAIVGQYYLEHFAKISSDVDYASEFRYRDPVMDVKTLVVLVSQSGETADTLAALREAKRRNIKTIAICNVRESTLAREADCVLYTDAGPEIGVASTKAFTTQLTVLYMMAAHLGKLRGKLDSGKAMELTDDLRALPPLMEQTLGLDKEVEKIAQEYHGDTFFFYMGRGIQYPIALEGALKLKEISYLLAEGYPAGELKHGPIALVDRRTVILSLSPKEKPYRSWPNGIAGHPADTLYEKQMSNLQEVKARGGKIISIGTVGDQKVQGESRSFIGIPLASWAITPILLSVPIQLLAYHVASFRGTDVDKPRNLAKSVTVE